MVNGASMVELYGQWCFNSGVCMVNGVSTVELYGKWDTNGGFCMVNGVSMVVYDGDRVSMVESVW